ncbi:MAG: squalene--hopene cyclase [Verrucomicrobiaceae bacterium]|nr:squalene--hopene cyclase [Verrucomicrobiaceae bacterium]
MLEDLQQAIWNTGAHLESLRHENGHWEGHLSSSALSTATAVVALHLVDGLKHADFVQRGQNWLREHQNADGGWGDTTISKSNLSTTLLCWSALHLSGAPPPPSASSWITQRVGSLEPRAIAAAVIARYGKDKTFSVPILMLCALCGTLGEKPWRHVLALPFELAALPRSWFGAVGLPVVSYALPALIAIGHLRFQKCPPAWWNPLRWIRALAWKRVRPMLKTLQPSSGGYLEATPLTSFVTMALAGAGDAHHPCVPLAVGFLMQSMREDGAWPIDTNLATWGTTLSIRAGAEHDARALDWLLAQQYREVHPFTNAAPGGWAWTDLPGGVPDADDTSSALVALKKLGHPCDERIHAGVKWLLDLQNRDGGIPTFCRGWGALPFDRSTPEITAHALLAWWTWMDELPAALRQRVVKATERALLHLEHVQRADGSWIPLWFGNEHTPDENNPVYGTAQVVNHLCGHEQLATQAHRLVESGRDHLLGAQKSDGSFGGDADAPSSIEETAVALHALALSRSADTPVRRASQWLLATTKNGTHFPTSPIGLYFARLWYHEQLYPVIWTLQALRAAITAHA